MKTCSYCGQEYPDEITICPTDGQQLPGDSPKITERRKALGVWRGAYNYTEPTEFAAIAPAPFTLRLMKQSFLGHFTGIVEEDNSPDVSWTGTIDGYFSSPLIQFTKKMAIGYITRPDGVRITLREHLLAEGFPIDHNLPSAPVLFEGKLIDANRMQGTWATEALRIPLPRGPGSSNPADPSSPQELLISSAVGYWCAQFVTEDLHANPTDTPAEPYFQKPEPLPLEDNSAEIESNAPADGSFRSMGKFSVMDAKQLLEKFEQENLRFEIDRDDKPMREMMPFTQVNGGYSGTAPLIEIFIHPGDELRAIQLMDNQT